MSSEIFFKMDKKLVIYFVAGFPQLGDTPKIAQIVQDSGADIMEIGIPYSDPVADGEIIQNAHYQSLKNGMNLNLLFQQLKQIKGKIHIPVVLMGYLNPILRYGFEPFCAECQASGVSGLIIPDLPPVEFERNYGKILKNNDLKFSFLVTPETPDARIKYLDSLSSGFLYAVSSSSTTGNQNKQIRNNEYLERLSSLGLQNPVMVGFGIKNKEDFLYANSKADGAIIGTAFVKILSQNPWKENAKNFIAQFKK